MGDPLLERGARGEGRVGVQGVVVAGQPGEHHHVRFGDGSTDRRELLLQLELGEERTARHLPS